MSEADEFANALAESLPADERMIYCAFVGDPDKVNLTAWQPRAWRPGRELAEFITPRANAYMTVSSFVRSADGTFRRRAEGFAAGRALMVDDVGTKVPPERVAALPPSAIVETSSGNFQWWYFLSKPEADRFRFDGLIRAFIEGKLLGHDPGMSSVTRVGRLPGFVNGKAKHNGFRTRLVELTNRRYSSDELLAGFGLQIIGSKRPMKKLVPEEAIERNRHFALVYKYLRDNDALKRESPDLSGWTEMTCPWVDDHTGRADTGAAIREPSEENEWFGAFRCHHGHCADKGWRDLSDYVADEIAEYLELVNLKAQEQ